MAGVAVRARGDSVRRRTHRRRRPLLARMPRATPQATTTITFWQTMNDEETKTLKTLVASFTKANPTIKVNTVYVPFDQAQAEVRHGRAGRQGARRDAGGDRLDRRLRSARLPRRPDEEHLGRRQERLPAVGVRVRRLAGQVVRRPAGDRRAGAALQQGALQVRAASTRADDRWPSSRPPARSSATARASSSAVTRTSSSRGSGPTAAGSSTRSRSEILIAIEELDRRDDGLQAALRLELRVQEQGLRQRLRQRPDRVQERRRRDDRERPVVHGGRPRRQGVQEHVEPRRRAAPEGPGRPGLAGRRPQLRHLAQVEERRRGVQVRSSS